MKHHDDISADFQGLPVTGFLVATLAFVVFMVYDMVTADLSGYGHGVVLAGIINQEGPGNRR